MPDKTVFSQRRTHRTVKVSTVGESFSFVRVISGTLLSLSSWRNLFHVVKIFSINSAPRPRYDPIHPFNNEARFYHRCNLTRYRKNCGPCTTAFCSNPVLRSRSYSREGTLWYKYALPSSMDFVVQILCKVFILSL